MNVHRSLLINIFMFALIIVIGMQSGCDSGSRSSNVPGIGGDVWTDSEDYAKSSH